MSGDYVRHFGSLQGQKKHTCKLMLCFVLKGKSLANFPQMEQLIENEEDNYMTLEESIEIDTTQQTQCYM